MKMYDVKNFPRTSKDFLTMRQKGTISFDNAAQRAEVWENTKKNNRKSLFIDTLIRGLPRVPPMYCNCLFDDPKNKVYDTIDGTQRITTVTDFMEDKFKLIGLEPFNLDEKSEDDTDSTNLIDLNGLTFSQLPQDFQDIIRTYAFTVYYYENLSQDEVAEVILRLNNGKTMSGMDMVSIKMKSLNQVKRLTGHPIMLSVVTPKGMARRDDRKVVVQSWALMYTDNMNFETPALRTLMQDAIITDEQVNEIEKVYNQITEVYQYIEGLHSDNENEQKLIVNVKKRIVTKTHLVSISPLVFDAIKNGYSTEQIAKWCLHFFAGTQSASISKTYNDKTARGTADAASVKKRMDAITEDYKQFIDNHTNKQNVDSGEQQDEVTGQAEEQSDEQQTEE